MKGKQLYASGLLVVAALEAAAHRVRGALAQYTPASHHCKSRNSKLTGNTNSDILLIRIVSAAVYVPAALVRASSFRPTPSYLEPLRLVKTTFRT